MAKFSKKHYIQTAKMLSALPDSEDKRVAVERAVVDYGADNPRFNEQLFRKACEYDGTVAHLKRCMGA